ncbi:MAG: hypothetical protein Q4F17_05290 [Eubacteriales bacterium]|nr:hypothetical protein [Eubacteriales bacterium]
MVQGVIFAFPGIKKIVIASQPAGWCGNPHSLWLAFGPASSFFLWKNEKEDGLPQPV